MKKFWKWKNQAATETEPAVRTLHLNGTIAEESWFDDDVTPQLFKDELMAGSGDITVWINSPGGDCVAAAQIYNMLMDYKGNVTVKIDGIAASAASVIAMAGTKVLMSPVSMMMIHNPMTVAFGDSGEMQKAIEMLGSVKDSIINAYEIKTGLSRAKLSHLMDAETCCRALRIAIYGRTHQCLCFNQERTDAFDSRGNGYSTHAFVFVGKEEFGRIAHLSEAILTHLVDAEFCCASESVLDASEDAIHIMLVAFEL